jgi:glycosyltransferase involved in cell wall biosynthesis
MRLLLVAEAENLGGAELSFLELSRALAQQCDLHLALAEPTLRPLANSALYRSLAAGPTTLHVCRSRLNPGTFANLHSGLRRRPAGELADLMQTLRPDVVIANLPTVERGQAIVDAARRISPTPPVWGLLHLVQRPRIIGAKLGWVRDGMVGRLLRRFDRLLTVSESGAKGLAERYGLPRPAVLHPPTGSLQPVSSAERMIRRGALGLPDRFLLGVVGRVELHQKGHDAVLRILAQLLSEEHPVHLAVLGDGPDMPTVRLLADRLGISRHVSFLGWRDDADAVIPLFDAVLMPSRFEGLPQSALQAATAEVAVIGYAVDGLTELLPSDFRAGYGDEAGLAAVVRELIGGTRRWPAAELARRARELGDPDRAATALLTLLRDSLPARSLLRQDLSR